ncbi:MAG: rhomboid family intramembrane serine protease [Bacteroidota bacterium]
MKEEKRKLIYALFIPVGLLFTMWVVKLVEYSFEISFANFGNYPLDIKGLKGIILMPFIHGSWDHLMANSVSFLVLSSALFYFYRNISMRVLIGIWLLSGIWVWFGGRPSWHIGASGIIYGLSSFLFFSGIIRKDSRLAALALIVTFLYGSLIWGVFPDFFPKEKQVSWEGHLGGAVAGFIMAIYYRNSGPTQKKYSWEFEEDEDDEDNDDGAYWNVKKNTTHT